MAKKLFRWISLEPDWGNYKPVRPLLEPQELFISIDVPDEVLTKGGHLTVEGMKYCLDQFEAEMGKVELEEVDETFEDTDEEWD